MIAISSTVLFMFGLVAASTMAQSVRERTSELAVLKTLGFSGPAILTLVLAESLFIAFTGGLLGLGLAWLVVQLGDPTNGMLPIFVLPPRDIVIGIGLMVLMGMLAGRHACRRGDAPEDHRCAEADLVMRWITQTLAVLALNIRTIPQRLSSSGVAIIGIAGVVVVFVSVLSIAAGFTAAMQGSGSPDRALVMRSGADSEMTSGLSGSDVDVIKQAPGIRREGQSPLAAAELMVIIDLPKKSSPDAPANVPVRGIGPESIPLRNEFSIVEGRMFNFGTNEVIAGRGAKGQFVNLNVGDTVVSGQNRWNVVGIFESDGGVAETEIWIDARTLQGAYRRGNTYQSLLARLESRDSYDTFRDWLTTNPQLNVSIRRENEYYASAVAGADAPDPHDRLRHRGPHGHRRGVRRHSHDVHRGGHACPRDCDTARARVQHRIRPGIGARRVDGAGIDRRHHRRRCRLPCIQRISNLDDELSDVQPGGVRVPRHARAARDGVVLRADDGFGRRAVSGHSSSAIANTGRAAGTLTI